MARTETVVECIRAYLQGTLKITPGTCATIVGVTSVPTPSLTVQIRKASRGTEIPIGNVFDVPIETMKGFWRTSLQDAPET